MSEIKVDNINGCYVFMMLIRLLKNDHIRIVITYDQHYIFEFRIGLGLSLMCSHNYEELFVSIFARIILELLDIEKQNFIIIGWVWE